MKRPVHLRKASATGNGAHIPVPKEWMGKEIAAYPADDVALLVTNASISPEPPGIGLEEQPRCYTSYFENQHGEQLIFTCGYTHRIPVVWHSDCNWEPMTIMHSENKLWAISNSGNDMTFNELEWKWIRLCLEAMGIKDYSELPKWEGGKNPSRKFARAILEGDKKTQIEVVEELLRQLKET